MLLETKKGKPLEATWYAIDAKEIKPCEQKPNTHARTPNRGKISSPIALA